MFCSCVSNQKSTSPDPFEIPADIAGIVHAGHTNTPEEYALLDKLGAIWTLTTFSWREIEPEQNQWDFDSYDEFVDTAKEAGKKIIGLLAYDVGWIYEDGQRHRNITPDKLDYFLNYARQTATHFQGRVDAWCIWNEPNTNHFWEGSMDDFMLLSRKTADAVREVDPTVIILGGAFNRGITGLPKKYARGLFESGAMEKADGVAFHPYELNPARTTKLYKDFCAFAARYGFADKIWVTEVGFPTGGWYPTKTTDKKLPEYVVKTFVNLAVAGAPKILWYQLFDPEKRKKSSSEHFFGLVRSQDDYTSKGAEAFRLCATYLAGTIYHPDQARWSNLPKSLKAFYFERPTGGGGTIVLWSEGASAKVNPNHLYVDFSGDIVVHDPVSGKAVTMPANSTITVGSMPVFVTWPGTEE